MNLNYYFAKSTRQFLEEILNHFQDEMSLNKSTTDNNNNQQSSIVAEE